MSTSQPVSSSAAAAPHEEAVLSQLFASSGTTANASASAAKEATTSDAPALYSDAASSQEEKESGAKAQPRSDEQYINARVEDTQQVAEVAALEKKMVAFIAKNVVLKKDVSTVAGDVFSEKMSDFRQEVVAQIRKEVESQRRAIVAEVSADVREELSTHGSEVLDLQKALKREQEAMSSEFKRMMEERMQKDEGKNEEMRTRLKMEIAEARRDELKALEARREKSRVAMENTLREEMRVERQKLLDKERKDSAKEIAELNVECIHMMSDAKRKLKEQGQEARAEMRKQLVEEREKSMKETVECMKKTIEKVETTWAAKLTAMRELGTKNQERIGSALHQIELLQTEVADITASAKAFKERSDSLEAKLAEFDALHLPRAKGERGVSFDEKKPHLVGAAASSSSGDASTPGGASTEAVAKKSQLNDSDTGVDETSTTAAAAIDGAADELSSSAATTRHSIQKVVQEHFESVVAPKMASSVHAMVDAKVDAKLQDMQEHLKLMKLGIQKMGAAGSTSGAAAASGAGEAGGTTTGTSKMNADAPSDAESMLSHGSVAGSGHQSDHENAKPLPKLKAITSSTLAPSSTSGPAPGKVQLPEQAAALELQALKADLELVHTSNKEFRRHMESNFQSYEDAILQVLETKFAQMRAESERLSTKLLTAFKTNLSKDLAKLDDRVNELEAANVGAGGGTKTAGAGSFEQQQKLLLDSILSGAAPAGGKMNSGGATDGSARTSSSGSDIKKGKPAGDALALVTADGAAAGEENSLLPQEHEQRVLDLCQASESRMRDHASQLARKSREGLQAVIEQLRSEFAETLTALETRIEHDYLPNLRASLISRELGVKKLSDWFCDAVALGDGSVGGEGNSEAADSRSNRVYDVLASHIFRPLLFAEVQKLERSLRDAVAKNFDAGFKRMKERELPPLVIGFVEQGFADLRVEDKVKYHAGVSAEEGRRHLADMIQDLVNTHAEQQLDRIGSAIDDCEKRLFSEVRKEASKQVQLAGTNLQTAATTSGAAHEQNKFKFSHSSLVPSSMSSSGAPPGASDDATRTLVAQKLADFQRPGGALEGQLESWAGSSLSLRGMLQRMLEREVAQLQAVFRQDLEEHKTGTQFAQEQKGEQLRGEILQEFSSMMREHREQLQKELASSASQFTALSHTTAEAGRGSGSNFYGSSPDGSSRQLETVVKQALVQQLQQSDFLKQAIRNKTEELRLKLEQRIDSENRALEQKLRGLEQNCLSELRGCVRENHLEARVADLKEEIGSVLDEFHGSFVVERMSKLDRELDLLREEVRRQREQVQIMDSRYVGAGGFGGGGGAAGSPSARVRSTRGTGTSALNLLAKTTESENSSSLLQGMLTWPGGRGAATATASDADGASGKLLQPLDHAHAEEDAMRQGMQRVPSTTFNSPGSSELQLDEHGVVTQTLTRSTGIMENQDVGSGIRNTGGGVRSVSPAGAPGARSWTRGEDAGRRPTILPGPLAATAHKRTIASSDPTISWRTKKEAIIATSASKNTTT